MRSLKFSRKLITRLTFSEDKALVLSFYIVIFALIGSLMPSNSPLIILRWVSMVPFFFVVPGFSVIRFVYPKGFRPEERFALGVVTSLAILPFEGLCLAFGDLGVTIAISAFGAISVGLQYMAIRERRRETRSAEHTKSD